MPRKSKLTPELILSAERLLRAGNYNSVVCDYLGIHPSTWYRWIQEGSEAKRGLKKEFYDAIKKAENEAEIRLITEIQKIAEEKRDWTPYAWILERKFPERWGRKEQLKADLNHSGKVDITAELKNMSEEQLEQLASDFDVEE